MERIIFHIDVNSAFLSWTAVKMIKDDPGALDLRLVPSVVGGDIRTRHGIVTAKSIPAKKYGIQTAEPITSALAKCPRLMVVSSDFATYREYSHAFIEILLEYSQLMQQASIDEAFLDVTELSDMDVMQHLRDELGADFLLQHYYNKTDTDEAGLKETFPLNIANAIRLEIRFKLGFTVNVGVSTNKLLAKMASDFTKPDRTHTLFMHEVKKKMWPLDIGDLFGCGKKTADRLRSIGLKKIGDAATYDVELLKSQLGERTGEYIHLSANGYGSDTVHPESRDAKSYSNETTTRSDITSGNFDTDMPPIVRYLSDKVSGRLKRDNVYGGTISVQVKTSEFKRFSRQMKLMDSTNDADVIYENAMLLLGNLLTGENGLFEDDIHIRLVGVGVDNLDDGSFRQGTLFEWVNNGQKELKKEKLQKEKEDKLDIMEKKLRDKFGDGVIKRGM